MKFVVVTSPRTGSTLITGLLHNLAKQWYGSKKNLWEYFTFTKLYKETYELVDNVITRTSFERGLQDESRFNLEEKNRRLEMLKVDPNYTFKIFSSDLNYSIIDFIIKNYSIICLERKDKLAQLLSYVNLMNTNISHYKANAGKVSNILYKKEYAESFFQTLDQYHIVKKKLTCKTLYYEDFMNEGANELALIKLLNLENKSFTPLTHEFIETPYVDNPENIIENKEDWLKDLPYIKHRIALSPYRS